MNVANMFSMLRIALTPVIIFALFEYGWEVALLIFLLASVLDVFDGYIARKYDQVTETGAFLDAVGDKVMILFIVISLMVKFQVPLIYAILILFRDIVVAIAVFIVKYLLRYKNKITFMAKRSGKNVTFLQICVVIAILIDFVYLKYLVYLTFIASIWCLSDYWNEWKKMLKINRKSATGIKKKVVNKKANNKTNKQKDIKSKKQKIIKR